MGAQKNRLIATVLYRDVSFEYPQHMFWLRNKKNKFQLRTFICNIFSRSLRNSYTMGCPPVRGDNPRALALARGLSYVQVDKHGIPILYRLHQCRPCAS